MNPAMLFIPFKWNFHAEQADDSGKYFLFKARWVLHGDLQEPCESLTPENLYAPVAVHETVQMFITTDSAHELFLEGANADYAYLYGRLDVPIIMEQRTYSTEIMEMPDYYCLLHVSLYRA